MTRLLQQAFLGVASVVVIAVAVAVAAAEAVEVAVNNLSPHL
ncbi:hypothetical protein L910_1354 [Vibrio fluvialis PG41]|uniref:Uncharacterized protein n=1 Tax=Vibrio fluvialis PG41 TaxID=1336752 RepID=S7JHI9_VIBFL|nr:hypothetical protein [Vibrio fluvialis]EPP21675.1 hypothetical protein L910_1354 [Vibrio fluvialis PG41]